MRSESSNLFLPKRPEEDSAAEAFVPATTISMPSESLRRFTGRYWSRSDNLLRSIELRLADLKVSLTGDSTVTSRNESAPWSIQGRASSVVWGHWKSQAPVTETHREAYRIAAREFTEVLAKLKAVATDLATFEQEADRALVPWTPGRLPSWTPE